MNTFSTRNPSLIRTKFVEIRSTIRTDSCPHIYTRTPPPKAPNQFNLRAARLLVRKPAVSPLPPPYFTNLGEHRRSRALSPVPISFLRPCASSKFAFFFLRALARRELPRHHHRPRKQLRQATQGGEGHPRHHRLRHQLRRDALHPVVCAKSSRSRYLELRHSSGDGATVEPRFPALLRPAALPLCGRLDLDRRIVRVRPGLDRAANRYQPTEERHVDKLPTKPRRTRPRPSASVRARICLQRRRAPIGRRHVNQGLQREESFCFLYVLAPAHHRLVPGF